MTRRQDLLKKISVLNATVWENRATVPELDSWLSNFNAGDQAVKQQLHAMHLLANFMYFGSDPMRELMKSLYRDLYKYPIVAEIRRANANTTDVNLIEELFEQELFKTRFVGVGNPSESGCHLLYYFRQENVLPKSVFIHSHEIFERYGRDGSVKIRSPEVTRYIFIDDLCGSGEQAINYSRDIIIDLKEKAPHSFAAYFVLFGTGHGLERVRQEAPEFNLVQAIYELDDTFKSLESSSRYFVHCPNGVEREFARQMCEQYGSQLCSCHPLGFDNGQLLLGFHHNIPDNTLPIIWHTGSPALPWKPIFRRYPKCDA